MGILIVAENRKARHDYHIVETMEAGLALKGSEVKSLRNRQCQLKDSYVVFIGNEPYLQNAHISVYKASSYNNHLPERRRKLLLHESQITKIQSALAEKGLSCVPLKVYFKKGWAKVEIALVKGKKFHDKRQTIKKRAADREMERNLRVGKKYSR